MKTPRENFIKKNVCFSRGPLKFSPNIFFRFIINFALFFPIIIKGFPKHNKTTHKIFFFFPLVSFVEVFLNFFHWFVGGFPIFLGGFSNFLKIVAKKVLFFILKSKKKTFLKGLGGGGKFLFLFGNKIKKKYPPLSTHFFFLWNPYGKRNGIFQPQNCKYFFFIIRLVCCSKKRFFFSYFLCGGGLFSRPIKFFPTQNPQLVSIFLINEILLF